MRTGSKPEPAGPAAPAAELAAATDALGDPAALAEAAPEEDAAVADPLAALAAGALAEGLAAAAAALAGAELTGAELAAGEVCGLLLPHAARNNAAAIQTTTKGFTVCPRSYTRSCFSLGHDS